MLLILALGLFTLSGCAALESRPLTFEEQQAQAAKAAYIIPAIRSGAHSSGYVCTVWA